MMMNIMEKGKKLAIADTDVELYGEFVSAKKLRQDPMEIRNKTKRKKEKKRQREKISLVHTNVRGIKSKIKDIISLAEDNKFDIMVFTETKLSGNENKLIPGYKNHRLNRQTKAGGVVIYYKEELQVKVIKKNNECETVWIEIECKGDTMVLGGVYSPCEDNVTKKRNS